MEQTYIGKHKRVQTILHSPVPHWENDFFLALLFIFTHAKLKVLFALFN